MGPTQQNTQSQPVVGMSLESLFLLHHLDALQRLENIIIMPELGEDARASMLAMQSAYLLHLLPDRDKQNEILKATQEYENELRDIEKTMNDSMLKIHSTFYIVTSIIQYLNSALDLTHEDIIGAVGDHVMELINETEKGMELEGGAVSGDAAVPSIS